MASQAEFTYQDYSRETSRVKFNVQQMTAANFDATITLINTLSTAILGVQVENALQTKRVVAQNNLISRAPASTKPAQREVKWVVTCEDDTLHTLSRHEIPLADTQWVTANTDFMDLSAGVGLTLKNAIEAAVLSPAGNSVSVASIQLVGRSV